VIYVSPLSLQVAERSALLHYYIEPATVEEVPIYFVSLPDYMAAMDAADSARLLSVAVDTFLRDDVCQTMVLLGDAGAGKSTFCWQMGQRLLSAGVQCYLDTPVSRLGGVVLPWIPIVIELKSMRSSQLRGLLPRLLMETYRIPPEVIVALNRQPRGNGAVRLLLFCDGYDELVLDQPGLNLTATLCGGEDLCWSAGVLKVVVTSRPNRLRDRVEEQSVFGPHQRCLLLPFTKARVRQSGLGLFSFV
jgi:hypothetical protein